MNLQEVNASASPEVQMNENFEALDFASVYAKNALTTTGLTWGYLGGIWGGFQINAGTLSLTAGGGSPSVVNYVVVQRSNGAISVSTSDTNWNNTSAYARVYKLYTDADSVTDIYDFRAGPGGVHSGDAASVGGSTITMSSAAQILLDDSITSAGASLPLAFDGDGNTGIFRPAADTFAIATGGAEAMRINASQVISFGTSVESVATSNSTVPKFIFAANGTGAVMQWIRHTSPGGGGPLLQLSSTRGTAADSYTVVQSGDGLGTVNFMGADGSDYTPAAQIAVQVDGTPGANDMPGRMVFATTADGAASPTERMRIANGGNIYCTGAGTTASAANAFLNSGSSPANELLRSTSSLRYKAAVEDIMIENYRKVLDLRPIWYRSLARADNPDWSFYGLGAEDVANIDPRLVNWGYSPDDYEWTAGEDGLRQPVLKAGAQLRPDGVAYERLPVLMLPILKDHDARISALEARFN
jgi:hypothetical protein